MKFLRSLKSNYSLFKRAELMRKLYFIKKAHLLRCRSQMRHKLKHNRGRRRLIEELESKLNQREHEELTDKEEATTRPVHVISREELRERSTVRKVIHKKRGQIGTKGRMRDSDRLATARKGHRTSDQRRHAEPVDFSVKSPQELPEADSNINIFSKHSENARIN